MNKLTKMIILKDFFVPNPAWINNKFTFNNRYLKLILTFLLIYSFWLLLSISWENNFDYYIIAGTQNLSLAKLIFLIRIDFKILNVN